MTRSKFVMADRACAPGSALDEASEAPQPDVQRERIAEVIKLEMREGQVGDRSRQCVCPASGKCIDFESQSVERARMTMVGSRLASSGTNFDVPMCSASRGRTCVFVRVRFKLEMPRCNPVEYYSSCTESPLFIDNTLSTTSSACQRHLETSK